MANWDGRRVSLRLLTIPNTKRHLINKKTTNDLLEVGNYVHSKDVP